MAYWNNLLYTLDVFDDRENLVEEIERFAKLDDARAAYDAALKKPRPAEHVLTFAPESHGAEAERQDGLMGPKPEPQDLRSAEHAEWAAAADRATRAAYPRYYWAHRLEGEKPRTGPASRDKFPVYKAH